MDLYQSTSPLTDADFLDFFHTYIKAEYEPIRSIWRSTATAEPKQPQRWAAMGHELSPTSFRASNPRTRADLEFLEYCIRKWGLDAAFVRGVVVRYSKYEGHERLEKKLYEHARVDLLVRKALKEKHLIDALWPSPAPAIMAKEMQEQGVQVRLWYGYMFYKYFRMLHAVDDFTLKPEVEVRIKGASQFMLVPFVEHIASGVVEPIRPIAASGYTYKNVKRKDAGSFGEPEKFEIRFDAPGEVQDTVKRTVVRQCQCLKCGSKRDVQVAVLLDPTPGGAPGAQQQRRQRRPSNPDTSTPRRQPPSKVAQRYTPGYNMPGSHDAASREAPPAQTEPQNAVLDARSPSPVQKKPCPACTFLNHPDLTACEMCHSSLPNTLVTKPPSPVQQRASKTAHSHSASLPRNTRTEELKQDERPGLLNRHSLSSTLLSYLPFPSPQPPLATPAENQANPPTAQTHDIQPPQPKPNPPQLPQSTPPAPNPPHLEPQPPTPEESLSPSPRDISPSPSPPLAPTHDTFLPRAPELTLMPLTPPPTSSPTARRVTPLGMPQSLMDEFVAVSPGAEGEEDAGWGEVGAGSDAEEQEEGEEEGRRGVREGMVDLDAVAREELGVWGVREED